MITVTAELRYEPDYAVPPGDSVAEVLEDKDMSQAELARRAGLSAKHVNQIIKGNASISPETAVRLENVLDVPARTWLALEATYQGHKARTDARRVLEAHPEWADRNLLKELVRRERIAGSADRVRMVESLLKFFGIGSIDAWESVWGAATAVAYRKAKHQSDPVALTAWMRIGELEAAQVDTPPFNSELLRARLQEARSLTLKPSIAEWFEPLRALCADCGVVLVLERELPGARVNGIARWITPTKALVQLSGRNLRDDIIWFTFFHEVGHLLLHARRSGPKDIPPTFVDVNTESGGLEDEANEFAAGLLIPPAKRSQLNEIATVAQAKKFAEAIGVSPGIVVGRLHHEGLHRPPWGQALFTRYAWAEK